MVVLDLHLDLAQQSFVTCFDFTGPYELGALKFFWQALFVVNRDAVLLKEFQLVNLLSAGL